MLLQTTPKVNAAFIETEKTVEQSACKSAIFTR